MHADLIVFSHLRWVWVWQRPQHPVSRVGANRKIWFVEEPSPGDVDEPVLRSEEQPGGVSRVWLAVPDEGHPVSFEDWTLPYYRDALPGLVGPADQRVAWLYTRWQPSWQRRSILTWWSTTSWTTSPRSRTHPAICGPVIGSSSERQTSCSPAGGRCTTGWSATARMPAFSPAASTLSTTRPLAVTGHRGRCRWRATSV